MINSKKDDITCVTGSQTHTHARDLTKKQSKIICFTPHKAATQQAFSVSVFFSDVVAKVTIMPEYNTASAVSNPDWVRLNKNLQSVGIFSSR